MTMPTRADLDRFCEPAVDCPVTRAVYALGGKWKLHIIFQLTQGTRRFGELQRSIPGVTQQMLTGAVEKCLSL